jgi:hypothetical protein
MSSYDDGFAAGFRAGAWAGFNLGVKVGYYLGYRDGHMDASAGLEPSRLFRQLEQTFRCLPEPEPMMLSCGCWGKCDKSCRSRFKLSLPEPPAPTYQEPLYPIAPKTKTRKSGCLCPPFSQCTCPWWWD